MKIPGLDATDVAVIDLLTKDPRASVVAIARDLGISRAVAHQRLARMLDDKTVQVRGLVDPGMLGHPLLAKLRITVVSDLDDIAAVLAEDPRTHWVTTITSGNQIIATASLTHPGAVSDFVDDVVRAQAGVDRVEVDLITGVFAAGADGVPEAAWTGAGPAVDFDEVDRMIIERLRSDGRSAFTQLGQVTGLSTASARQRALRLIESGTIRLRVLPDPEALGIRARAEVHLQSRGNSTALALRIAGLPHANYVCRTVGHRDIHAEFYCADDAELLEAVAALRADPDVGEFEFYRYERVVFANPVWA